MSGWLSVSGIDGHKEGGRAAMLKERFAETIFKATQQLRSKKKPAESESESSSEMRKKRRDLMVLKIRRREREIKDDRALEKMAKSIRIYDDILKTL